MKKLLFLAFICISTFAKAQNTLDSLPEVDGKVFYQSIGTVPGKSQDFIFAAANKWMLDNFGGDTGGILSEDKEQGQILGRCAFTFDEKGSLFNPAQNWAFLFSVQIDCKDGKYRIQLYNAASGVSLFDKNAMSLEDYNDDLKTSKSKVNHENAYLLDARFKAVMQSLADAVNKAAKDDF